MADVVKTKSVLFAGVSTLNAMGIVKYTTDFGGISSTPISEAQASSVDITPSPMDKTYTVSINGTDFDFVAVSSTPQAVSAGLTAAINAGAEPVTATDNGVGFDVVADTPGASFTITVNAGLFLHTSNVGVLNNIKAHMVSSTNEAAMGLLMDNASTPTCVTGGVNGRDVTVDFGAHIVADLTVVSNPTETTFIKFCLGVDDVTGDPEVFAFDRVVDSEYAAFPTGKTHSSDLKEYSLEPSSALVEINDFIGG